jgi:hypothetical protein
VLAFGPGLTAAIFTGVINGDEINECYEHFTVLLSNPVGQDVGVGAGSWPVSIPHNDAVQVSVTSVNDDTPGAEASSFLFTVSLDTVSVQTVTVNYTTTDGSATSSGDYTRASGTLTFNPGVTLLTVPVAATGDGVNECVEDFSLELTNPIGLSCGNVSINDSSGTATIIDDDAVQVSVTAPGPGAEDSSLVFTVSLDTVSTQTVKVDYATKDFGATSVDDYMAVSGTLLFNPGVMLLTVPVLTYDDAVNECDKTFLLELTNPIGLSCASVSIGTPPFLATINDDDPVSVSVTAHGIGTGVEGSSLVFAVSLDTVSEQTVTVDYKTTDGSATSADDYTAAGGTLTFNPGVTLLTVPVLTTDDAVNECEEDFSLELTNPIGLSCAGVSIGTPEAEATINDDDPVQVSVTAPGPGAEDSSIVFTVTLDTASTQAVTVDYTTTNGTATSPGDFTPASGTLTFNPGVTLLAVPVAATGDAVNECDETFDLDLTNPSGLSCASVSIGTPSATATINDDDAVQVSVTAPDAGPEGDSFVFTVSLDTVSTQAVEVDYFTADGTAESDEDYSASTGTLFFSPGITIQTVGVDSIDDQRSECVEMFTVELTMPLGPECDNVGLGGSAYAEATISDDEISRFEISPPASRPEGDPLVFSVTIDKASQQSVRVSYNTTDGTAHSNMDYVSASGTLTFDPGITAMTLRVETQDDPIGECPENVLVTLSDPIGACGVALRHHRRQRSTARG